MLVENIMPMYATTAAMELIIIIHFRPERSAALGITKRESTHPKKPREPNSPIWKASEHSSSSCMLKLFNEYGESQFT